MSIYSTYMSIHSTYFDLSVHLFDVFEQTAGKLLEGTHDFTTFGSLKGGRCPSIRLICPYIRLILTCLSIYSTYLSIFSTYLSIYSTHSSRRPGRSWREHTTSPRSNSVLEHFRFTLTETHKRGSLSIYSTFLYQGVIIPKYSRVLFAPTHRRLGGSWRGRTTSPRSDSLLTPGGTAFARFSPSGSTSRF